MECALIESFCNKIKTCPYLMDCEVISVFTNPRLSSSQIESQLKNLTKQSCSTSDTLNRFKQSFIKLSGREVDQNTHNQLSKWRDDIKEQQKLLLNSRAVIESAMTQKVKYDSAQRKLFDELGDIEEFMAQEVMKSAYVGRASQRSLDKY